MDSEIPVKELQPFKRGLLTLANKLRKEIGFAKSSDVEDALAIVLTHIVTGAQTTAGHIPVSGFFEKNDAILGATFLCFVGSPAIIRLRQEGIELSINDVVARAGFAVFQFFDDRKAAEIISRGMEQYKAIIAAGEDRQNIRAFSDSINQLVDIYGISGDEQCIPIFSKLYMTLINAQEKQ